MSAGALKAPYSKHLPIYLLGNPTFVNGTVGWELFPGKGGELWASLWQEPDPSACDRRPTGRSSKCDEDVTATEATKADGGALGMRLVTVGKLDAHRQGDVEASAVSV